MSQTESIDEILRLVSEVYASILNPERFVDVLELWDKNVTGQNQQSDENLNMLERQLINAIPLLETSLRQVINKDELANRVADYDRPSLLIASHHVVVGSNAKGRALFNLYDGDRISQDLISKEFAKKLNLLMHRAEEDIPANRDTFVTGHLTTLSHTGEVEDHLVAMRIARVSNSDARYILISSMEMIFQQDGLAAFQNAFALTDGEMKILVSLVSGMRQIDIAAQHDIREDTVKKHLKTIREKTKTSNTTALVCLAASFAQLSSERRETSLTDNKLRPVITNSSNQTYVMPSQHKLATVNGYRMEYAEFGQRDASPVLILHSSMVGFVLPPEFINELIRHGYRVIVPFRPGTGVSDHLSETFSLEAVSRHLLDFASSIGLKSFALVGGTVGFAYAAKMAALAPERITALIGIAGYVPVEQAELGKAMAPYQRGVMFTLKKSRPLAKILVLGGYKMFLQLGAHGFFTQMMRHSKADLKVVNNSSSLGLLSIGLRIAGAQGVDALLNDMVVVMSDWSDVLDDLEIAPHLIHGTDDSVFDQKIIEDFCRENPKFELTILKNHGQLMICESPIRIAGIIVEKLKTSRGAAISRDAGKRPTVRVNITP